MRQPSEADLAAAMLAGRQGDEAAYGRALREIAKLVRARIGRRLAGSVGDLEDVVQEVLLSVHMKRATWDETRPLMPWVNAIADHKAIDAIRKRARDGRLLSTSISADDVAELVPSEEPEPSGSGFDVERRLAALPTRERQIVQALTVQGRSVRDLATELGMKEGTVRVALHRGLKRLALAARRTSV